MEDVIITYDTAYKNDFVLTSEIAHNPGQEWVDCHTHTRT